MLLFTRIILLHLAFVGYFSSSSFASQKNLLDTKNSSLIAEETPISVSLIFNTPLKQEAYSIYGHLAIRIQGGTLGRDRVYNFGVADFDAPNFLSNFVSGRADDYLLVEMSTKSYFYSYLANGCDITELVLNLSPSSALYLESLLLENLKPENVYYRYNFHTDNCATRPIDLLKKVIKGRLSFPTDLPLKSTRKLIDSCNQERVWQKLGTDLALGSEADQKVGVEGRLFLPVFSLDILRRSSIIRDNGITETLVREEISYPMISEPFVLNVTPFYLRPAVLFTAVFLFFLILFSYLRKKNKRNTMRQCARFSLLSLFLIEGIAGCILFYLAFLSLHPLTNPNWHLVAFNPLQLILGVPLLLFFSKKKITKYFLVINSTLLIIYFFLFMIFGIQTGNPALYSIAFFTLFVSFIFLNSNSKERRGRQ